MHVALDLASSFLTTVAAPLSRYRYLRLPFDISSAPVVFHCIIADYFSNIPGVYTHIDDLLVVGSTVEEHDSRLKQVKTRFRQINLGLNAEKCRFGRSEIPYLGHVLSSKGSKPDPA